MAEQIEKEEEGRYFLKKNKTLRFGITIERFKDKVNINFRYWVLRKQGTFPTQKGCSIGIQHLNSLIRVLKDVRANKKMLKLMTQQQQQANEDNNVEGMEQQLDKNKKKARGEEDDNG